MLSDPTTDNSFVKLAELLRKYEAPAYVKQASFGTFTALQEAPVAIFASPTTRQFPTHTKAATWLSALYFLDQDVPENSTVQAIGNRIIKAAEFHGILPDVLSLEAEITQQEKTAAEELPDSCYTYVWLAEDGSKQRYYPLTNGLEVKQASEWLYEYRNALTFKDRHVIATKILEKAAEFGATVKDRNFIEKQAGRGTGSKSEILAMLRTRAQLLPDSEFQQGVVKLAAAVTAMPTEAMTCDMLVKMAEVVYEVDAALGFTAASYSAAVPRPEDVCFSSTFYKQAQAKAVEVCELTTGAVYEKKALSQLTRTELQQTFGDQFVAEVSDIFGVNLDKLADAVETLPADSADMISRLLASKQVYAEKQAAENTELSWMELASKLY